MTVNREEGAEGEAGVEKLEFQERESL